MIVETNKIFHAKDKIKVYLPENIPNDLKQSQWWLIHVLYRNRFHNRKKSCQWVRLKKIFLHMQLGRTNADDDIADLINRGIIEQHKQYVVGYHSMGYRLTPKYRYMIHREHALTDKLLLKRLEKWHNNNNSQPILSKHQATLSAWLHCLGIDKDWAIDIARMKYQTTLAELAGKKGKSIRKKRKQAKYRLSQSLYSIEMIDQRMFFAHPDEYGRFHTNLTNLAKELRQCLYCNNNGDSFLEIDVANSQPLFLSILIKTTKKEEGGRVDPYDCNYQTLVETGAFYKHLQEKLGYRTIEVAKKKCYTMAFGERTATRLREVFPQISDFIDNYKVKDYKHLAHALQRLESDLVLKEVSQELAGRGIMHWTIHDSIMILPVYEADVREVMADAFRQQGHECYLRRTKHNEDDACVGTANGT